MGHRSYRANLHESHGICGILKVLQSGFSVLECAPPVRWVRLSAFEASASSQVRTTGINDLGLDRVAEGKTLLVVTPEI